MNNQKHKFMEFGVKHEISKRWPISDWKFAKKVGSRIDLAVTDRLIGNLLKDKRTALIGRLGGSEARFLKSISEYENSKKISLIKLFNDRKFANFIKRSKEINLNAGFYFDKYEAVLLFKKIYDDALSNTDILGAWGTAFASYEIPFAFRVGNLVPVPCTAPWVEPYGISEIPWSHFLDGKKVLILSPFTSTIEKQHQRIDKVFKNTFYPRFELSVIKVPQTNLFNSNYSPTWFEKLEEMQNKMREIEFDIALIGGGAYSYPLANFAKQLGKIGVHSGGGLQLFFGILGKRWEPKSKNEENYLNKYINEYWVRPSGSEVPIFANQIEGGCYW